MSNALPGKFNRGGFRQSDYPVFGGAVGAQTRKSANPCHGRDVDDDAAARGLDRDAADRALEHHAGREEEPLGHLEALDEHLLKLGLLEDADDGVADPVVVVDNQNAPAQRALVIDPASGQVVAIDESGVVARKNRISSCFVVDTQSMGEPSRFSTKPSPSLST